MYLDRYGWHFPELARVVTDNLIYTKVVHQVGMRHKCALNDLSGIVPEDIEVEVKAAAEVSMGTEITDQVTPYITTYIRMNSISVVSPLKYSNSQIIELNSQSTSRIVCRP